MKKKEDEKLDKKEESEKTFPCTPRNLPDSHPGPHPTFELAISRAHLPFVIIIFIHSNVHTEQSFGVVRYIS